MDIIDDTPDYSWDSITQLGFQSEVYNSMYRIVSTNDDGTKYSIPCRNLYFNPRYVITEGWEADKKLGG